MRTCLSVETVCSIKHGDFRFVCIEDSCKRPEGLGNRKEFFTDLHTITAYPFSQDWHILCSSMVQGNAPSP
jgi:hypothetical protein